MLNSGPLRSRQMGVSVIELPIITLVMVTLMLFAAKLNQGIQVKSQLEQLAYSLTALTVSDSGLVTPSISKSSASIAAKPIISNDFADSMLLVAQRHLNVVLADSSAAIGIYIEQATFDNATAIADHYSVAAGSECLSKTSLATLTHLAPVGRTAGLNAGKKADLFQLTICITDIGIFAGDFASVLMGSFSDEYFRSSALLIGRKI